MTGWAGLSAKLGVAEPVFQAGMGGVATAELSAAVAEAGGGGILGLYKLGPDEIRSLCRATEALTSRPFGVNLVPEVVSPDRLREQVRAALAACVRRPFVTFFGLPDPEAAAAVLSAGARLLIQVGETPDALRAVGMKADALIVQGNGAGGHHLGVSPLPAILREVRRAAPEAQLIAAGGVAADSDFAELAQAGASAVLMGTRFVCATESAAHPDYKQLVAEAGAGDTEITDLLEIGWPGRPHRVLRNETTRQGRALPARFIGVTRVMGGEYPVPRFSAAVPTVGTRGAVQEMALYCGTSCRAIDGCRPASEIVREAAGLVRASWRSAVVG